MVAAAAGTSPMSLHPDRALPADPHTRDLARRILAETIGLPIRSLHGHVDPAMLADDAPFRDPAALLITPDHYLLRMIASQTTSPHGAFGVSGIQDLGRHAVEPARKGDFAAESDPREIWRHFCRSWHLFRATPTRFWMEHVLVDVFGAHVHPSAETADALYDHIAERLETPTYRPRALFERFGIELLATTDPAEARLSDHERLAHDGWGGRVIPTFRPDTLLNVSSSHWRGRIRALAEAADAEVGDFASFLHALRLRRATFIAAGARATDHGHLSADTTPLPRTEAERIFATALRGEASAAENAAFAAHMLFEMAAMSAEDGLTMQLHPGVLRDHSPTMARRFGHDIGYDIPVPTDYVHALRPVLDAFGHDPNFRLIVFTVDETAYSRELAPLAGTYPALRLGAPWWFLDSPDAMRRFREASTDTAGFYNTSGFVDDTRAFCSIPARHDLARRIDAGHLGRLVAEHRLHLDEAIEVAIDLGYGLAGAAYPSPMSRSATPETRQPPQRTALR